MSEAKKLFIKYKKTPQEIQEWIFQYSKKVRDVNSENSIKQAKINKRPFTSCQKKTNKQKEEISKNTKKSSENIIAEINALLEANNKNLRSISTRLQNLKENESDTKIAQISAPLKVYPTVVIHPTTLENLKKKAGSDFHHQIGSEFASLTKSVQDLYYDYLSPEKGENNDGSTPNLNENGEPFSQRNLHRSPSNNTDSRQSLTPAYKLLDVSPHVLRNKSHQAKKLVDLINKSREVHKKPAKNTSQISQKRPSTSNAFHPRVKKRATTPMLNTKSHKKQANPLNLKDTDLKLNPILFTQNEPDISPSHLDDAKPELLNIQRPRTSPKPVFSKFQTPNKVLHVNYIEFQPGKRKESLSKVNPSKIIQHLVKKSSLSHLGNKSNRSSIENFDDFPQNINQDGFLSEPRINMLKSMGSNEKDKLIIRANFKKKKPKICRINSRSPFSTTRPLSAIAISKNNPNNKWVKKSKATILKEQNQGTKKKPKISTSPLLTRKANFPPFINGKIDLESPMAAFIEEYFERQRSRISTFEAIMKQRIGSGPVKESKKITLTKPTKQLTASNIFDKRNAKNQALVSLLEALNAPMNIFS